jgi:hypothetical protein
MALSLLVPIIYAHLHILEKIAPPKKNSIATIKPQKKLFTTIPNGVVTHHFLLDLFGAINIKTLDLKQSAVEWNSFC